MAKNFQTEFKLVILSFLAIVFSSCNENEEEIKVDLISIYADEDYFGSSEVFVIASDGNGDVIEYAQLKRGDTTTLSSTNFNKESFTLSLVYTFSADNGDKSLFGQSYYDMKREAKLDFSYDEFDFFTIQLSNYNPDAAFYNICSNRQFQYIYPGMNLALLTFFGETSRIFNTIYSKDLPIGVPMHYSFPATELNASETGSLDLASVNTDFDLEVVSTGEYHETFVSLHGILGTGQNQQVFQNIVNNYTASGSLDFWYPGNVFGRYASTTVAISDNYEAFIFDKDSKYNFTIPTYTYSSEGQGPAFTFSASGGDWIFVDLDYENSTSQNSLGFRAYVPTGFNQIVNMVKLPEEIIRIFDGYNYENWEFDHESPTVVEFEDYSSLSDYIVANNQKEFTWFNHNSSSVILNPEPRGGRTDGRKKVFERLGEFSSIPGHPRLISKNQSFSDFLKF
jgi:hypothetical protein